MTFFIYFVMGFYVFAAVALVIVGIVGAVKNLREVEAGLTSLPRGELDQR
jgi:hypothetical protein